MNEPRHNPPNRPGQALFWIALPIVGISVTLTIVLIAGSTRPERLAPHEYVERAAAAAQAREARRLVDRFGENVATLAPHQLAMGRALFAQSCAVCHGPDGRGVPMLGGKDLVHSDFVTDASDAELIAFLEQGRDPSDPLNTTGMPMPAKGGNPDLNADDLRAIVTHLRGLQDPRRVPEGRLPTVALKTAPEPEPEPEPAPAPAVAPEPVAAEAAATVASAEAERQPLDPEAVKRGKRVYMSCIACHGRNGTGVKGVGKNLVASEFVLESSDDDLLAFIKQGRGPSDPANTTGLAMPPKGGNPSLKDEQIRDVIAYIRSLGGQATIGQAQSGQAQSAN